MLADRYEMIGELGSGSTGVVFRAHDTVLDRDVALKELRLDTGLDEEEAVSRFLVEAQAAARLSHPSIVRVHDVFAEHDRVLMSMELLDGPTLAEVIASGPLGSAARPIMSSVASALAEAHRHGVVHRDLKPENIFVLPSGRVVVCDFGLARLGGGRGTGTGTIMGTPGYMSPEQLRGDLTSAASDVFSWGVVAYELAHGSPPFGDAAREDFVTLSWRLAHEDAPRIAIPEDPDLVEVISRCLEKEPAARPEDGRRLVELLGDVRAPAGVSFSPTSAVSIPGASTLRPASRRGRVAIGVVAAVAAIALTAAVALVVSSANPGGDKRLASAAVTAPLTEGGAAPADELPAGRPSGAETTTTTTATSVASAVPFPTAAPAGTQELTWTTAGIDQWPWGSALDQVVSAASALHGEPSYVSSDVGEICGRSAYGSVYQWDVGGGDSFFSLYFEPSGGLTSASFTLDVMRHRSGEVSAGLPAAALQRVEPSVQVTGPHEDPWEEGRLYYEWTAGDPSPGETVEINGETYSRRTSPFASSTLEGSPGALVLSNHVHLEGVGVDVRCGE